MEKETQNKELAVDTTQNPSEVIITNESGDSEPKKKFSIWFWLKTAFFLILAVILIIIVLFLVYAVGVYRDASKYKKAYDDAISELNRCDSIKGTAQKEEVFTYCDTLRKKFGDVER